MRMKLPDKVNTIIHTLQSHGYEAYAVGGCVRDSILGREPEDWDITTSALPGQVKQVFGRTLDTGIQHGTVTVMVGRTGYEVTTYRIDGEYSDGRHPDSVAFTPELREDLRRRDFTINAMAYNRDTGFVDMFGGVEDLERRVIRCVGEPMERFTEDALRILRAIRFSAQLGFQIEERTYEAIRVIAPNLRHVSKERIQMELTKLLVSPHPEQIAMVYETGISLYVSEAFHRVGSGEKGLAACQAIPPLVPSVRHMRWAAFLRQRTPAEAAAILRDLKLDNDTVYRVKTLVDWVDKPIAQEGKPSIRRTMSSMEPKLFDDLLTLKQCLATQADCRNDVPETMEQLAHIALLTEEIRRDGDCTSLKMLAVTGRDVIQAGVKPGKDVGVVLAWLLEQVLECPEQNTREYLLSQVRKFSYRK